MFSDLRAVAAAVMSIVGGGALFGACVLLGLAVNGCAPASPPVERVVLISIDTLRPDYLGCYDPARDTTPHLDRFAGDSVVFTDVLSHAPSTTISHKSLLYSLYPAVHKTRRDRVPVEQLVSPVEALRHAGFTTGAITGRGGLAPELGFDRGFDSYEFLPQLRTGQQLETLRRKARSWLAAHGDERFFLFLHAYEPHCPYTPPEPWRSRYAGGYRGTIDPADRCGAYYNAREMSDEDLRYLRGLYAAEVAYVDDVLGDLFAELERLDLYEGTLVVVTSDHGDSLGERGYVGHNLPWHLQLRVPLIVRLPGVRAARVDAEVESIDVMPTIFAALGVEPPFAFQGRNLIPWMQGESPPDTERLRLANQADIVSVHRGRWHLVFDDTTGFLELFDVRHDPLELENLAPDHPGIVRDLREAYADAIASSADLAARFVLPEDATPELTPETAEQLKALGYVD